MLSTLSVRCIPRGPNMVIHGFLAFEWKIDEGGEPQRINILPLQAMIDNVKQDPMYTSGAVTLHEAMHTFDAMLEDCVKKEMRLRIQGDVSGINYYLALAERGNIFSRKWVVVETVH
jgi:hypothetical protein